MNDFQEQAKNWLRNVVKQNPDKIKAGVEKAGDLIDKQTGGKYAEKVDAVQQKVGGFVDKNSAETPNQSGAGSTPEPTETTSTEPTASERTASEPTASGPAGSEPAGSESAVTGSESTAGASAGTSEAAPGESTAETPGASQDRAGSQGSSTNG
ncbi:antitoxin protein of toxin-antitoxin system [Kribbella pratensis]|uniref:Antitoxin protein of toxin-antitoxin system n=1 Tax=Kribbella pratensis TaxID=2512112 RepID=A0ABY2FMU0_9ACTN|nr:antitoxin [Kribbella pratensis]TDW93925.1 antitoxin protein of toxin-antitoxin system [Kribbella pratensis]